MSAASAQTGQSNTNSNSAKQSIKKGKKRKRKQSPEEQYQIESTEAYDKLTYACSKHLHRESKVVKSFECQKIVRAIKAAKGLLSQISQREGDEDSIGSKHGTAESIKARKKLQVLHDKLERTKRVDLDTVVQVGLKRLGVFSLNPQTQLEPFHDESAKNNDPTTMPTAAENVQGEKSEPQCSEAKAVISQREDPFYQTLIESMLQHKRLAHALDSLHDKITEHRKWRVRREAMLLGNSDPEFDLRGGKKKKNKDRKESGGGNDTMVVARGFDSRKRGLDLAGHEGASGLFIGSLSGVQDGGYDDGDIDREEEDYCEEKEEKKKNRPGQRARRAKAMAVQARKAGKTWDSSINWREKQKDGIQNADGEVQSAKNEGGKRRKNARSEGRSSGHRMHGHRNEDPQLTSATGKAWKEEGNAHPSWAAAAAKKPNIAKYQGTKITFD
ncbi:hypothetical protein ACHAWF_007953 [Thalassiosira exigua]